MTRRQIETSRERQLGPRYVKVNDRRVPEPAEVTEARRAKLNEPLPWPAWYFMPELPHLRSSLGLIEEGER